MGRAIWDSRKVGKWDRSVIRTLGNRGIEDWSEHLTRDCLMVIAPVS